MVCEQESGVKICSGPSPSADSALWKSLGGGLMQSGMEAFPSPRR